MNLHIVKPPRVATAAASENHQAWQLEDQTDSPVWHELQAACICHEQLKTLRRWNASLQHRLEVYGLKAEYAAHDAEAMIREWDELAHEVMQFRTVLIGLKGGRDEN